VSVLAGQNIAPETATIYVSTSSLPGAIFASEKCSSVHYTAETESPPFPTYTILR
jgi:hypothetical protein